MQHDLSATGQITPLPRPMIDTGLGLERIVMLKSGVDTVFETDILRHLIERVESLSGRRYQVANRDASAFRVIADHARSIYFAITDGALPSNVDRGYVIRKLIRRAARYGKWLGLHQPFLALMLPAVEELMGQAYPKLGKSKERVAQIVTSEEISFARALRRGENILRRFAGALLQATASSAALRPSLSKTRMDCRLRIFCSWRKTMS